MKRRIIETVLTALLIFIGLSVINKLFLGNQEQWLVESIITTIAWTLGVIFSRLCPANYEISVVLKVGCLAMTFLIAIFLAGNIVNIPEWKEWTMKIFIPFAMAFLVSTK